MRKNWVKKGLVCGIIMLFIGVSVVPISCADKKDTVYVNNDNTKGPWEGNKQYPYQYIQVGIENVFDWGTVYVYNGTYNENIFIDKPLNLMKSDRSDPGDNDTELIIDGGGSYRHVIEIENTSYVKIDGFIIQNSGIRYFNAGIYISGSNHINIWNNTLFNNTNGIEIIDSTFIYIGIGTDGISWIKRNNTISYNLRGKGIYIEGICNDIYIEKNIINNCETEGIFVNSHSNDSNINIKYNTIFSCIGGGIFIKDCGYINIYDNKIYDCGPGKYSAGNGIAVISESKPSSAEIWHNIIYNTTSGIAVSGDGSYAMIWNNNIFNCYDNGIYLRQNANTLCRYNEIYNCGISNPDYGSGIFIESDTYGNLSIKNNSIHGNPFNLFVVASNIRLHSLEWNNIENYSNHNFDSYVSVVHAESNYWGKITSLIKDILRCLFHLSSFQIFQPSIIPYYTKPPYLIDPP